MFKISGHTHTHTHSRTNTSGVFLSVSAKTLLAGHSHSANTLLSPHKLRQYPAWRWEVMLAQPLCRTLGWNQSLSLLPLYGLQTAWPLTTTGHVPPHKNVLFWGPFSIITDVMKIVFLPHSEAQFDLQPDDFAGSKCLSFCQTGPWQPLNV